MLCSSYFCVFYITFLSGECNLVIVLLICLGCSAILWFVSYHLHLDWFYNCETRPWFLFLLLLQESVSILTRQSCHIEGVSKGQL